MSMNAMHFVTLVIGVIAGIFLAPWARQFLRLKD